MRTGAFALGVLALALPARALAATEASLPAAGGLEALAVRVDLAGGRLFYQSCPAAPCAAGPQSPSVALGLDPAAVPAPTEVTVETLPLGHGRRAVHVRVPYRGQTEPLSPAWEAVIVAGKEPVFAGVTGLVRGSPGERTGEALRFVGDGESKIVVKGDLEENLHVCGDLGTLLRPQGLDAQTLVWHGATLQRIPPERRAQAESVAASLRGGAPAEAPLAPLLFAEGASTAIGLPKALVDGDPETTWSEGRPGHGQGEFVVFHAPHEVPLSRFAVAVAPKNRKPGGAAPRTFYLATDAKLFEVTMPEDAWQHPGAAYDIPLPEPVTTSCVALVLGDAYAEGTPRPDVTLAELYAYSPFDGPGAKLEAVASALAGGGPRAEAAAGVLKRAGDPGLAAGASAYATLDAAGRALAVDVAAASSSCAASSKLLVLALADPDEVVRDKARAKLEEPHCGKAAVPALLAALDDPKLRPRAATLVASLSPSQGLAPLARVLGQGTAKERLTLRSAFAHAAARATPPELAALVAEGRAPEARVDLLRAMTERIGEVKDAADLALAEILAASPPMPVRYVLGEPMEALAKAGDAKAEAWLTTMLAKDADAPVRAHAAELAGASARTQAALEGAVKDDAPRVREAALRTVGAAHVASAEGAARRALAEDPWTFVRTEAATALGALPAATTTDDALARAVDDRSPRVRVAAITGLALHRAVTHADPVRARLLGKKEDPEVRATAARAAGPLCDVRAVDALEEYAVRGASSPEPDEVALGLAATEALGQIHPPDLAKRLKKVYGQGTRPDAKRAADAAMAAPPLCR